MLLSAFLACASPPPEGEIVPLGERYQLIRPPDAAICDAGADDAVWLYEGACPAGSAPLSSVRYPWSLSLRLAAEPPDLDCRPWPDVIGRRYLVWSCHGELEGGMGEPEHTWRGWTKLDEGQYLRFSFAEQGGGSPRLLWSVIASVRRR